MGVQQDMFGEPPRAAVASQWFTPMWLARKLAYWVPNIARVLEPSCGSGNLIAALVDMSSSRTVVGIDFDGGMAEFARARFAQRSQVNIVHENFLTVLTMPACDVAVMNPPFEGNLHMRFVLHALEIAPVVVGIFPASFEFGIERDRELWATRAVVTNRARLPERVDYGGDQSPSFDSVALRITRRSKPREPGERLAVYEEVWRP